MSTGADAMGVAAWLTPVLIVAAAAGLAHPAVGQPADPAPSSADTADLIDPDCDPAGAEQADPLLVEEPDGVCPPPDEPGGDVAQPEPAPAIDPDPAAPPAQAEPAPPAASPPAALPPQPIQRPRPEPGPRRRPTPAPEQAPRKRAADRHAESPARGNRGGDAPTREKNSGERRDRSAHRRRSRPARRAPRVPVPLASLRALPEPLPPARRLAPRFARRLERVAERHRVPWELLLAVRRARGHGGAVPASADRLRVLARRLVRLGARRNARRAVRRLARALAARAEPGRAVRRRPLVRRVVALAHLNRAIGLRGLVRGLKRVRRRLARQVLASSRLAIYEGGRHDIASGLTDVRVLVLLRYLASRWEEVTVTSLTTGHSFFTASGNVSAHSFGRAVDIAALNGRPILGNQEPGGLTERALRAILLLPESLRPRELISLFELGGPSFALADHADHIHAGW
jgi:hypothetical protein